MKTMIYDRSWMGLLTAIFEAYEYRYNQPDIIREGMGNPSLFGDAHKVITNDEKGNRVLQKLRQRLSPIAVGQFYKTWLSELAGIENNLLGYVRYQLSTNAAVENDYSHPDVLLLQQVSRKVHREKHRMEAFVRFQLTGDGLYYSIIQPDFNVLPLIVKHFRDRYADQRWLIYDAIRRYGMYYDLSEVSEVELNFDIDRNDRSMMATIQDQKEELYQRLWQQYFSSVNIPARKNMKLHIQHMPRRYWRNLVEKQPGIDRLTDDSQ